jgi:uncharacterized membrane protein
MPDANLRTYRRRTGRLMRVTLALWALFALCIPVLVVPLNAFSIPYVDLPLGFLMTTPRRACGPHARALRVRTAAGPHRP